MKSIECVRRRKKLFLVRTEDIITIFLLIFYGCFAAPILGTSVKESKEKVQEAYTKSDVCGGCHKDIYSKWKNSMHAYSYSDPVFQGAYLKAYMETRGEAKKLCLRCHAPFVIHTGDYDLEKDITKDGIGCDFCHTIKDVNLSNDDQPFILDVGKTKRGPYKGISSPAHETAYSQLHERSEICGGCHDMRGPKGVLILGTYTEWRMSKYYQQKTQCQNCHMPALKKAKIVSEKVKKSNRKVNLHELQGGHYGSQLKKATKIEIKDIKRSGEKATVVVEVTNSGAGHMIPTGIPSRTLTLEVTLTSKDGKLVLSDKRIYRKIMIDASGKPLEEDAEIMLRSHNIQSDSRIYPGETRRETFTFLFPAKMKFTASAQLVYRYAPQILTSQEMKVEMAKVSKNSN
ncbi:MAG: multiheme c-type cytochrome [bacterium]